MLIKKRTETDTNMPVISKILYSRDGEKRDVSREGAFCADCKLKFTVTFQRIYGICNIFLRICDDNGHDDIIGFDYCRTVGDNDVYSLKIDLQKICENKESGLFYYDILFSLGNQTLYSDTRNNVDFRLCRNSARRFRLLIYSPGFRVPSWLGKNIMYHIFVDRFSKCGEVYARDGAVLNEDWKNGFPDYADSQGEPVLNNVFFGGNLYGVAEKLDYIKSLGAETVYLSPIFEAPSNHKYDTSDYTLTDGMFGGNRALEHLLDKCKEKNIRIILDGVFNHTGDDSIYFNRKNRYAAPGAYNSQKSVYYNWYTFTKYPDEYECWWNIKTLPRLNHKNEKCRKYFTSENGIGAEYVRMGTDGWRLDVADELHDDFLDEFRESVKSASGGEAVIIGEVWENAADKLAYGKRRKYFQGKQLDSVMNYPLREGIIEFVLHGDGEMLYNILTDIYSSYPRMVCDALMNLLGTHDTARILSVLADVGIGNMSNAELASFRLSDEQLTAARKRLKIASVIQYTVYGFPCIYYGDEAGMQGGHDPFCRLPFPWGREDREILSHYIKLGMIRQREQVYSGGDFRVLEYGRGYFIFERSENGSKIITAANSGESDIVFMLRGKYTDLLTNKIFIGKVTLRALDAMILKREGNDYV